MVDAKAGIILIILIFYFIGFSLFVNSTENATSSYGINSSVSSTGGLITSDNPFGALEYCATPRNYYNQKSGEYEKVGFFYAESTKCDYTLGGTDLSQCAVIDGCSVINDTSGWIWDRVTTQVCDGNFNLSSYTTQNVTISFSDKSYLGVGDFPYDESYPTLCSTLESQTSCNLFGCTWLDEQDNIENIKLKTIWATIGELFTFELDIGLSTFANFVFITIFFYIPFLILLIALYMLVPFI